MTEPPKSRPLKPTATERLLEEAARYGVPVKVLPSKPGSGMFIVRLGPLPKAQGDSRD